jgi:hypothetical protein
MIDYYNLKLAHELAEKYHNITGDAIVIEHNCCFGCYVNVPCQFIINQVPTTFNSIKDMIQKLTELTRSDKQKPKYKDAWYLLNNKIESTQYLDGEGYAGCEKTNPNAFGKIMYPSREALVESQIEHWSKLKLESMNPEFEGDIKSFGLPTIEQAANNTQKNIKELGEKLFPQQCPLCGNYSDNLFPIPK